MARRRARRRRWAGGICGRCTTWRDRDPLKRLRILLERQYEWTEEDQSELESDVDGVIDDAWEEYQSMTDPVPDSIFESTYEALPDELRRQRDELRAERSDG